MCRIRKTSSVFPVSCSVCPIASFIFLWLVSRKFPFILKSNLEQYNKIPLFHGYKWVQRSVILFFMFLILISVNQVKFNWYKNLCIISLLKQKHWIRIFSSLSLNLLTQFKSGSWLKSVEQFVLEHLFINELWKFQQIHAGASSWKSVIGTSVLDAKRRI